MAEFVELQRTQAESEHSWTVKISDINRATFDLSAKNPNTPIEPPLRSTDEILKEMEELDKESAKVLAIIKGML